VPGDTGNIWAGMLVSIRTFIFHFVRFSVNKHFCWISAARDQCGCSETACDVWTQELVLIKKEKAFFDHHLVGDAKRKLVFFLVQQNKRA
jgi:hypothetical protein